MGDIKQGLTNRAARVLTLINLHTSDHFCSAIKFLTAQRPAKKLNAPTADHGEA